MHCEHHRAINYITRCDGQWIYLIILEVADFEEARTVRNEVQDSFFHNLARVVSVPQAKYQRYFAYPFETFDGIRREHTR